MNENRPELTAIRKRAESTAAILARPETADLQHLMVAAQSAGDVPALITDRDRLAAALATAGLALRAHDTALAELTRLYEHTATELEQTRQQLAGVRALHRADSYQAGVKGCRACSDCCDTLVPWPCATIRALDVAAEPCAAICPGLPFVACTYPVGHPPIPKDIRGAGWRDMDHGNDGKHQVWWNGSTAIVTGDAVALPADGRPASMLRAVEFDTEPEPDAAQDGA